MNLYSFELGYSCNEDPNGKALILSICHTMKDVESIEVVYNNILKHIAKSGRLLEASISMGREDEITQLVFTTIVVEFSRDIKKFELVRRNLEEKINDIIAMEKIRVHAIEVAEKAEKGEKEMEIKEFEIILENHCELVGGRVVEVVSSYWSDEMNAGYDVLRVRAEKISDVKYTDGYSTYQGHELMEGLEEGKNVIQTWIEVVEEEEKEEITFNPENTAIDTRHSKSADLILDHIAPTAKVLDYGCGTGRNMKHILDKANDLVVDGTDITEQLKKEQNKHDQLRAKGCTIVESKDLKNNLYDVALNSHVLNVVESDEVKTFILKDIHQKLKNGGKAVIEVRTKADVEGAKTKEPYGNGWKIKKGNSYTYQEAISKEKMIELVTNAGFKIVNHICNSSQHIITLEKQ